MKNIIHIVAIILLTSCSNNINQINNINNDSHRSEKLMQKTRFSTDGYKDIKLGDKYDAKLFTQDSNKYLAEEFGCKYESSLIYDDIYVMFQDEKTVLIDTVGLNVTSEDGIAIGDSLDFVYEKLSGKRLEVITNEYSDEPVIIDWHDKEKTTGTRYDIENGKVIAIGISYNEAIYLMEGCA